MYSAGACACVLFFSLLYHDFLICSGGCSCISEELCTIERNKWKGVGQEENLIGSAYYYYYYTCIKQYTCIRDVKTTSWTIQETQISSVSFIFSYPRNIPRTVNRQRAVEWVAQQRRQKRNLLISSCLLHSPLFCLLSQHWCILAMLTPVFCFRKTVDI